MTELKFQMVMFEESRKILRAERKEWFEFFAEAHMIWQRTDASKSPQHEALKRDAFAAMKTAAHHIRNHNDAEWMLGELLLPQTKIPYQA